MDTLRFSRICDDGQDATESRHRQSALAADRQPNLSAFDWIRVAAAFGVVTLHACVPYLKNPMPGLNWAVTDASSTVVDVTFWSIEVFIMPVFLVIAGILSWYSLSRRGPMELFRSRTRRLGKPLLFGLVVILPMDLYTWLCGWVFEEHILPIKIKSLKIEGPLGEHLWGTGHLWFLGYLLSYVACLALAYHFWKHGFPFATKKSRIESGSKFPRIPARIVLGCLTAIGVCVLTVRPEVVWGFQHAFAPVPSKWIYSATFFVGGVWLARQTGSLDRLKCHSPRLAMPSLLVLAATLMLGRWHLADHEPGTSTANIVAPALAILTTVAAWSITLASLGMGLRWIRKTTPGVSYLAAASFWVYLVHHPLLALVHIDLKFLAPSMSPLAKATMAFAITSAVSLLTYEAFVRRSILGRWLGMNWSPSPKDIPPRADSPSDGDADILVLRQLQRAATPPGAQKDRPRRAA